MRIAQTIWIPATIVICMVTGRVDSGAQGSVSPSRPSISPAPATGIQTVTAQIQSLVAQISELQQELRVLTEELKALQPPTAPGPQAPPAAIAAYNAAMAEYEKKRSTLLQKIKEGQYRIANLEKKIAQLGAQRLTVTQKADYDALQRSLAAARKQLDQAIAISATKPSATKQSTVQQAPIRQSPRPGGSGLPPIGTP